MAKTLLKQLFQWFLSNVCGWKPCNQVKKRWASNFLLNSLWFYYFAKLLQSFCIVLLCSKVYFCSLYNHPLQRGQTLKSKLNIKCRNKLKIVWKLKGLFEVVIFFFEQNSSFIYFTIPNINYGCTRIKWILVTNRNK